MPLERKPAMTLAIACGCVLLAAGSAGAPPRWTALIDVSGACCYAVPPDWKIDAASESTNTMTSSPDGRATSVVQWSSQAVWPALVATLRSIVPATAVHEQSRRRFWIEYASAWPGVHHLAVIPANGGGCMLYVDVSEKADPRLHATATEIIRSLTALR
ncbi:MAG: hypothetical protein AUJ01_12615 [Acidobacteria bacterium 13_1_40CM_3_65_5]|nr:MAG: hypothetical protein AUJ01_12615 [Acidobacteria bacterium 13_1_40CM_3_65_5]